MPATFTRTPVETERKDPGFGGNRRLPDGRQAEAGMARTGKTGHPAGVDPVTCWVATAWYCFSPWPAT
jgi:hypothetical protein